MAERKPLFMDATEGFSEEMSPTADTMTLLGLKVGATGVDLQSAGKVFGVVAATTDGDALVYGQSGGNLAGLSIDTNPLSMGSQKITGLAAGTDAGDAINKSQLDAAVQGFTWKDPVIALHMVDDSLTTAPTLTANDRGYAYIVAGTGGAWSTFAVGDLVEWDGTSWVKIETNTGGEPTDGMRVVVTTRTTPAGSFTGEAGEIAQYDATGNSWSFYDPIDGDAVLVAEGADAQSVYHNNGYVWDETTTTWIQFTGAGSIIAGDGLSKDGNTLDVNAGDGIAIVTDRVTVDLYATNPALEFIGTTPDGELAVKQGDGITSDANGLTVDLTDVSLELVGTSPDKTLGVNPGDGIQIDATHGVAVDLSPTNPGLELIGTSPDKTLQVQVDGAHGIIRGTSGLEIEIDDTPDTLDVDADGLKVVGLPSLFKINDIAVGATVTAANLDELTDGSTTALHTHAGVGDAQRVSKLHAVDEAIAVADPVYISSANRVGKGRADTNAKARIIGIAETAQAVVGNNSTIIHLGLADSVLTTATAGTPYYLQATGGIGTALPGAGNRVIQVGIAYNADDLWVHLIDYGKKAA